MTSTGAKLGLLLWKNWKLQMRHPIQTVVEIVVPVLFAVLILVVRLLVTPTVYDEPHIYTSFHPIPTINGTSELDARLMPIQIAWTTNDLPTSEFTKEVEDLVKTAFEKLPSTSLNLIPHHSDSPEELEEYMKSSSLHFQTNNGEPLIFVGIVFDDVSNSNSKEICSEQLQVTLRFPGELRTNPNSRGEPSPFYNWRSNLLFPMFQDLGPRDKGEKYGPSPYYVNEGFTTIQVLVSEAVTEYCFLKTEWPIPASLFAQGKSWTQSWLKLRRFSYPPYTDDVMLLALESIVSSMLMLGFVYTCIVTVKVITTEKEHQVKEAMKIMGLPTALHWIAWFIKTMVLLLISVALVTVILKIPVNDVAVFTYGSGTVLFVFLTLFAISTTFFCFMVSVFFSKANTAATVGGLCYFLAYMPYSLLQYEYETMSMSTKILTSLLFNSAMGYGFRVMVMNEGTAEGQHWRNLFRPATQDDDLTMGHIFIMFILDSCIYMLITLYVEAVFPGDYGVPKPWYFPVQKSFWCGHGKRTDDWESNGVSSHRNANFEQEPTKTHAGVQIRNLRKVFHGDKVAVDNLSLNMYEGQITVLLGHNGAGKTTTMSMLTGVYTPTSGKALVNGYDVRTEIAAARESLGLCPQHNVLFEELTVREHLYFFGKLKGLTGKELEEEIQKYVKLLQLEPKENKQSRTLSGGMKRKLSAGVALCGKSKVVMFDEPTSGMDPAARRALWDLLREEKAGRTVLLTTHFMDEADLLGDRIAIMAGGRLQCAGSPFFLKKRYGAGYRLVVVKGARCDAGAVTQLLARHLPGLTPAQDVGTELSYQLDEEHSPRFEPMLRELEEQRDVLDVLSYGVSLTTMEEVFIKVGKDHEVSLENGHYQYQDGHGPSAHVDMSLADAPPLTPKLVFSGEAPSHTDYAQATLQHKRPDGGPPMQTGSALLMNQLQAMFIKKGLALARGWVLLLVHILLPIIFLIIALVMGRMWEITQTLPARDINLESYTDVHTVMAVNNEVEDPMLSFILKNISDNYEDTVSTSSLEFSKIFNTKPEDAFDEYMLNEFTEDLSTARRTYIVGATFDVGDDNLPEFIGWFNDQPYHTVPLALNLLFNAILKIINVAIDLVNYPLPYTAESQVTLLEMGSTMGFQIAFNVGFSMSFVSAYYILFPIKERVSKAKHLQFVSGANVFVFWGVHLVCDGISFLLPSLGVVFTLAAFQEDGFASFEELARVFVILICFGWSMLPFMYLSSYFFSIPASGYTRMAIITIFVGIAALMVVATLKTPGIDQYTVGNAIQWILLLVPHYCLADAINSLGSYNTYVEICTEYNPDCTQFVNVTNVCCPGNCPQTGCVSVPATYFQLGQPGIGRHIIYSLVVGCLFNILIILIDFRLLEWIRPSPGVPKKPKAVPATGESGEEVTDTEDSDVLQEKERIQSSSIQELSNNFSLVLRDVTKYYGKFLAVDRISIGVKRGECFGLLGVNGAGKTTTFKMMTGDERITGGEAFLESLSLKGDMKEVHKLIGYCPQFDAVIEEMTGRETLRMFCLLRGISADQIPRISLELADELLFSKHIDKPVKEYSGGNKRKLSTAVALIGDPPVVFLDEPTTGMDPVAKRHLWNVICKVRDRGKSIILTSHSMEECEALCTRLVIMVNGTFKCLGSTQHLKNKFAEGYTLIIKVGTPPPSSPVSRTFSITSISSLTPDLTAVKNFVNTSFPGALLREEYMGLLTYYIPNSNCTWSEMFGRMERAKQEFNIEDYSLGQTSLEQVFLSFTKSQKSETP